MTCSVPSSSREGAAVEAAQLVVEHAGERRSSSGRSPGCERRRPGVTTSRSVVSARACHGVGSPSTRARRAMSSSMALSTSCVDRLDDVDGDLDPARERRRVEVGLELERRSASGRRRGQAVGSSGRTARSVSVTDRAYRSRAGGRFGARTCSRRPTGSVAAVPVASRAVRRATPASTSSASATPSSTSSPTPTTRSSIEHELVKGSMTLIDTDRARRALPGARRRRSR